jgi:hypothetical protein
MDEKGAYFLPVKYGRNPIELKKGVFSFECDSLKIARIALANVRKKGFHGAIDEQLSLVTGEIRTKLQRRQSWHFVSNYKVTFWYPLLAHAGDVTCQGCL